MDAAHADGSGGAGAGAGAGAGDSPDVEAGAGSAAAAAWTTRRLLTWLGAALAEKGIDSARLCAEMLVAHVLGCERLRLYTDADRPASREELDRLRGLAVRALRHEPIQYLTGTAWFFGMEMMVDARVLIPRPSSETIVEDVLQTLRARGRGEAGHADAGAGESLGEGEANGDAPARSARGSGGGGGSGGPGESGGGGWLIADVCTGSGCLAVALARHAAGGGAGAGSGLGTRVIATDISAAAVEVARANAARHAVGERVEFRVGDLLSPLGAEAGRVDVLVANPPYIPDHEWAAVARNVRDFEPSLALRGGVDGLAVVGPLVRGLGGVLAPGGVAWVELAACTAEAVLALARSQPGLTGARVLADHEGLARVLRVERARG